MSDKYASDKEMQNLFEGFRSSLNETLSPEQTTKEENQDTLDEGRMKYLEGEIVNGLMEMMQQYDVTLEDIKGVIDSGAVQNVMDMLSDKNRPPREPVTPEDTKRMYTKTI